MAAITSGGVGHRARAEPVDHRTARCDQKLLEVPLHIAGLAVGVGRLGEFRVKRVTLGSVHVGLRQQGERHAVGGWSRTSRSPRRSPVPGP